jgi:hypothetical protein
MTAPARSPTTIQAHWVPLVSGSLFFEAIAAPAAAAPAGLTPEVVVVPTVVTVVGVGAVMMVVVWVCVTATVAVVVTECVTVGTTCVVVTTTVVGGRVRVVVTTAVVAGAAPVSVGVVAVRAGVETVGVVRVTSVCVAIAWWPPPHEVSTKATRMPSRPAAANGSAEANCREPDRPRSIMPRVYVAGMKDGA